MKKISNFIVEKRNFIIPIFIILAIICVFTSQKVKINKNKTLKQKKTNLKHTKYTKIEQINKNQLFKQRKIRIKTIQNKQKIVRANNVKNRTVRVFFKPYTK